MPKSIRIIGVIISKRGGLLRPASAGGVESNQTGKWAASSCKLDLSQPAHWPNLRERAAGRSFDFAHKKIDLHSRFEVTWTRSIKKKLLELVPLKKKSYLNSVLHGGRKARIILECTWDWTEGVGSGIFLLFHNHSWSRIHIEKLNFILLRFVIFCISIIVSSFFCKD